MRRVTKVAPAGLVAVLAVALSLAGCGEFQPEGLRVARDGKPRAAYPVFGNPILVRGSSYVAFPFSLQYENVQSKGYASGFMIGSASYEAPAFSPRTSMAAGFGGYQAAESPHWNNVAFYDRETRQTHLMLDRRGVICRAYFPSPKVEAAEAAQYLLLGIAWTDTSGDGFINEHDAITLYRADLDGRHLVQLTPDGTTLESVVQDGPPNQIYVRVVADTNGDRAFTEPADRATLLRINVANPGGTLPVIPDDVRDRARAIVEQK